jgi:hypothetical protein
MGLSMAAPQRSVVLVSFLLKHHLGQRKSVGGFFSASKESPDLSLRTPKKEFYS